MKTAGIDSWEVLATVLGSDLELIKTKHPLFDRDSLVITGDHVTLDAGTGCVHTAPGHGREDYEVCLQYGIDIYSPLNDRGEYLDSVEFFAGLQVQKANPNVIEKVKEVGNLMGQADITHSYPHCWRCKKPVIFRATTQWFVSMEANELRQKALKAIRNDVEWIPSWGEERIYNMIEQRPDWCISRQLWWGHRIPAWYCEDCGETIVAKETPEKCPKCGKTLLKKRGKSPRSTASQKDAAMNGWKTRMKINVIGGGLAGCEAAWQAANAGAQVTLYEMKPEKYSPAHHSQNMAELVCSNSLKASRVESAAGLLKEEMRRFHSLLMECADLNPGSRRRRFGGGPG